MEPPVPVTVEALLRFIHGDRMICEAHVAGSRLLRRQEWTGYQVHHDARRGPERFVDDVLIAQALACAQRTFDPPRLLVLATGDGNANYGRPNFPQVVQTALASGSWAVELITWRTKMHASYTNFLVHYIPRKRFDSLPRGGRSSFVDGLEESSLVTR